MSSKVAVVTGSNKGIGYGIVRELCKREVDVVYLTARDVPRGLQAVENLKKEGLNPEFHQLDVTDEQSVKKFADHIKTKYSGLDILINNAAVIGQFNKITYDDAKQVIDVNYKSYFNIQEYLFPILNDNARVINISSDCGHITNIKNEYWIKRLINEHVEVKDIDEFLNWYLKAIGNNTLKEEDFCSTMMIPYRLSKIAVCALTRVQQKKIGRGISINSLHPGFVKTDMTKSCGELTIEEASEAPVYLALDCEQSMKGKYIWYDKSEKDWTDTSLQIFNVENTEEVNKLIQIVS